MIEWLLERWGARRARQGVVLAAVVSGLLIALIGVLVTLGALRAHRTAWAWTSGLLALLALWLWLRSVRARWAALQERSIAAAPVQDDTAVWGVGGPNLRTPGATGVFRALSSRSDARDRDHDQHA